MHGPGEMLPLELGVALGDTELRFGEAGTLADELPEKEKLPLEDIVKLMPPLPQSATVLGSIARRTASSAAIFMEQALE